MATNSQLSTTESKNTNSANNQNRTESYIWRSFGGMSAGRRKWENGGKVSGIKKHNW